MKTKSIQDLTGKKFGRWLVVGLALRTPTTTFWNCVCECGIEGQKAAHSLKSGRSKSCGCGKLLHAMSKTRFYGVWNDMYTRCNNPKSRAYYRYGGRGIKLCARWHVFMNFYADMFASYRDDLTIERKNVNGNYTKRNCKWIPAADQKLNKSNVPVFTINGLSLTIPDWGKRTGVRPEIIRARIKKGWRPKRAILTPESNIKK
jgi:hypothetical protein